VAVALCLITAQFVAADAVAVAGNPIRKVLALMQNMQVEIEAEGQKEKDLFDKFMCFCGGSSSDLQRSVADSTAKVQELSAKFKSLTEEKSQLQIDIAQAKKDREGAKNDAAEATSLRAKEHAEFEDMSADSKNNIAAMGGAMTSLDSGMGGASLMQMPHSDRLHKLVETYPNVDSLARRNVLAFLDQSGDYIPQSGQIVGILKQMRDDMGSELRQATTDEQQAAASFNALKSSKDTEVKLASDAIESKTARSGEIAVAAQQTKDAVQDEQEELADATKFLGNLGAQCATKQKEWDERVELRNDEITAIGEAMKILSDDAALDVFKKALPSPSALQTGLGFLQRRGTGASTLEKARVLLSGAIGRDKNPLLHLMLFTLNSRLKLLQGNATDAEVGGPAKPANKGDALQLVSKIVDGMLATLTQQQADDDKQQEWCNTELTKANDEDKGAKGKVADLDATVSELADSVAQLDDQIKPLKDEVMSLDRSVAEATEQRKDEHAEYAGNIQMNTVAKTLMKKAVARLHKFYRPALVQKPPPAAPVMSKEEKLLTAGTTFLQLSAHKLEKKQPAAPATFSGGVKKNKGSVGVIGMMETIIQDLDLAGREAEMDENTAQKDYSKLMGQSQQTRSEYSQSITNKEEAKAVLDTKLLTVKQSHRDAGKDLEIVQGLINDLHISCDYLLDNYETRKEGRAAEMDSLKSSAGLLDSAHKNHTQSQMANMVAF